MLKQVQHDVIPNLFRDLLQLNNFSFKPQLFQIIKFSCLFGHKMNYNWA